MLFLSNPLHLSHGLGNIVAFSSFIADFGWDVLDNHQPITPTEVHRHALLLQDPATTEIASLAGFGLVP